MEFEVSLCMGKPAGILCILWIKGGAALLRCSSSATVHQPLLKLWHLECTSPKSNVPWGFVRCHCAVMGA